MIRLLLGGHADGSRTRKLMAHLGSVHMSALFTCRKRRTPSSCMHARMRPAHAFSRTSPAGVFAEPLELLRCAEEQSWTALIYSSRYASGSCVAATQASFAFAGNVENVPRQEDGGLWVPKA